MKKKWCTKCHREYPATREYFYSEKRAPNGLRSECKVCTREHNRTYHQQHKKQIRKQQKKYSQSDKGKAANKKYQQSDKGKIARNKANQKYQKSEEGKAAKQEYQQSDEGRAIHKKANQKYYNTIKGYLGNIYSSMNQRCNNPKDPGYKYYGGRGIELRFTVDDFRKHALEVLAGRDPHGLDIHRTDNDGHYEIGNIEFLTPAKHRAKHKERKTP